MVVRRRRSAALVALLASMLVLSGGVATAADASDCRRSENAKKFRCLQHSDRGASTPRYEGNGAPEGFEQFDSGGGDGSSFGGGGDGGGGGPM